MSGWSSFFSGNPAARRAGLLAFALPLLPGPVARALPDPPPERAAYAEMVRGDRLREDGDGARAAEAYRRALEAFESIRREHPDYKPGIIRFRIGYCRERARELAGPGGCGPDPAPGNPQWEALRREHEALAAAHEAACREREELRQIARQATERADELARRLEAAPGHGEAPPANPAEAPPGPGRDPAAGLEELLAEEDWEEAGRLARRILEADPDRPDALLALVRAEWALGRAREALRLARPLARAAPDLAPAQHAAGALLLAGGEARRSLPYLRRAVRLDPGQPEHHRTLALACYRAGRLPEAADAFRETVRLDPEDGPSHFNLAALLVRRGGDRALAREAYDRALALGEPADPVLERMTRGN